MLKRKIHEKQQTFTNIGKMPINPRAKAHAEYICPQDEFDRIMQRFPQEKYFHISLVLPYYTGTRLGETFGIDLLQDIDFNRHELHIRRQMTKVGKEWYMKPPKYDSYRTLKIGSTLEQELKCVIHMELGNVLFHAHCLRHTHGTILAENGVNPKTVMERLGHKDIQTTLRTYTFNTEVMQQTAVDVFEQAVQ